MNIQILSTEYFRRGESGARDFHRDAAATVLQGAGAELS
jgi:hypothetical protein